MAVLWVTEFDNPDKDLGQVSADASVTFTTAVASSAFNDTTRCIRLIADANCHIAFGTAPTATVANQKLLANVEYWRTVKPGDKVSVYDGAS